MGETTGIKWTTGTFSPWKICTPVSDECANCYAWLLTRRMRGREYGHGEPREVQSAAYWKQPGTWNRKAKRDGTRKLVFCASMVDVFDGEFPADLEPERQKLWQVIRETPYLDWQLLTKRPNLIKKMLPPDLVNAPNIWLGTSVGMESTTWRIPKLLETPAVVHFLSIEPLLGPIPNLPLDGIDWVILGGESGERVCSTQEELERRRLVYLDGKTWKPKPTRLEWVREIRDQCVVARVPLFFKQWGGLKPGSGGHVLDGREWREMPNPLRNGDGSERSESASVQFPEYATEPASVSLESEPASVYTPGKEVRTMRQKREKAIISKWMSRLGKKGGQSTSPAKLAAAARNAKLGGRPRKSKGVK